MRLLRVKIENVPLYEDAGISIDFVATDRVVRGDEEATADVTKVGISGSIYSENVVGITGVNASGKTTTLNLLRFVLGYMTGSFVMRQLYFDSGWIGKLGPSLTITVVFWEQGAFYQLRSELVHSYEPVGESIPGGRITRDAFSFIDETLWRLEAKRPSKRMLTSSSEFESNALIVLKRNGDEGDPAVISGESRAFLDNQTSIVSKITGKTAARVERSTRRLPEISMPTPVIQAFDASVESLTWDAGAQIFRLKFKGEEERLVSMGVATRMLSSGTIAGAEMVGHAIDVLREGGYFIVDEIENSLNRSLVGVILNLFASPVTNPHGAQMIFSTHYPELLDLLRRKDNVYVLTRTNEYKTRVIKYSSVVDRVENKKSEVILHNVIPGSMPSYPDVQAMRDYVRRYVQGE